MIDRSPRGWSGTKEQIMRKSVRLVAIVTGALGAGIAAAPAQAADEAPSQHVCQEVAMVQVLPYGGPEFVCLDGDPTPKAAAADLADTMEPFIATTRLENHLNGQFLPMGHKAVVHGGAIGVPVVSTILSDRNLKTAVTPVAWDR
jgi:hypothetical protein